MWEDLEYEGSHFYLVSALLSCFCLSLKAEETAPNVLLIAIDDLNDWIGCMGGHPQAQTPHMDRLAARECCSITRTASRQSAIRHAPV